MSQKTNRMSKEVFWSCDDFPRCKGGKPVEAATAALEKRDNRLQGFPDEGIIRKGIIDIRYS